MRAIAIAVTTVVVSACATGSSTAPADKDFWLRTGHDAAIEQTGVHVHFLGVTSDSRCAVDVQCVWSGNAEVALDVRAGGEADTLLLNTHQGAKEGIVGNYRIVLVSLAPLPHSERPIEPGDYRVSLRVVPVEFACTMEARPALHVTLVDSLVPDRKSFTNVAVLAVSGSTRDSAFVASYNSQTSAPSFSLAHEQAGTYTVTVRADGYQPWVKTGVQVERDVCHVKTVQLTARLVQ